MLEEAEDVRSCFYHKEIGYRPPYLASLPKYQKKTFVLLA